MRLLARQRSVYGKACEVTLELALKACIANQFAADIIPDRAFVNSAFDVELVPDNHPAINGLSMKMPEAGSFDVNHGIMGAMTVESPLIPSDCMGFANAASAGSLRPRSGGHCLIASPSRPRTSWAKPEVFCA